jgi:hypothetical protein
VLRRLFLTLQKREKSLAVLLPTLLVFAHHFQSGLGFGCVPVIPFQVKNARLLFGKLTFTLNYLSLYLSQLI